MKYSLYSWSKCGSKSIPFQQNPFLKNSLRILQLFFNVCPILYLVHQSNGVSFKRKEISLRFTGRWQMNSLLLPETWNCRWHLIYDNKRAPMKDQPWPLFQWRRGNTGALPLHPGCTAKWSALLAAYPGSFYLPISVVSAVIILEWSHLHYSES